MRTERRLVSGKTVRIGSPSIYKAACSKIQVTFPLLFRSRRSFQWASKSRSEMHKHPLFISSFSRPFVVRLARRDFIKRASSSKGKGNTEVRVGQTPKKTLFFTT